MKKATILLLCAIFTLGAIAQNIKHHTERLEHLELVKTSPYNKWDVAYVQREEITELYKIPNHPAFDSLLTKDVERRLLSKINFRLKEVGKDTLFSSDYFYVWKPYFDWLENEDPHYRIAFALTAPGDKLKQILSKKKKVEKLLPIRTYCINDSIIISSSIDPNLRAGDLITAINGVSIKKYSEYYYKDRNIAINNYLTNYNDAIMCDGFDITVVRDNKELNIRSEGRTMKELSNKYIFPEEYNQTVYADAKCGYIQIKEFYDDNSRLIKIVSRALKSFKKEGLKSVIIDIRRNPGGSGDRFDELLSVLINKPSIDYLKGQKLRVSEETLGDYDFLTEDMIGKNIEIPKEYIATKIELDNSKFINGLNYYVLVSKDTGSVAATFANIMHYNDAATLVGEPLKHNALKYGEILTGSTLSYSTLFELGVSTTEYNEYTKAQDGVLAPDINIPYVARDYMTGKDAVLEKLLDIIRNR